MSWLFSRALVEEFLPASCLETERSAPLRLTATQHPFLRNDKTMDCSRFSRFGATCEPLTESLGAALLTAFLAGSRAKTSPWPDVATDWMEVDLVSGVTSHGLFATLSRDGSEWRTPQCSLLEGSDKFSGTWPRSGLMRDGMSYQQQSLALGTFESASGSLLPTLTVCGNYNAKGASATSGDGLATALRRMPTLMARDYRSPGRSRLARPGGKQGEHLPNVVGGPLNPDWCEWFMGFPIGWTASDALETHKFQEWRQQHSPLSPPSSKEIAT
jgi:hypothetical protein